MRELGSQAPIWVTRVLLQHPAILQRDGREALSLCLLPQGQAYSAGPSEHARPVNLRFQYIDPQGVVEACAVLDHSQAQTVEMVDSDQQPGPYR